MWAIEKIEKPAFIARYGKDLSSTAHLDQYDFTCVIIDIGNQIALMSAAVGECTIKMRAELGEKLKELGFKRVRWYRVVEKEIY